MQVDLAAQDTFRSTTEDNARLSVLMHWNRSVAEVLGARGQSEFPEKLEGFLSDWIRFDDFLMFCYREDAVDEIVHHNLDETRKDFVVDRYAEKAFRQDPFYIEAMSCEARSNVITLQDLRGHCVYDRYYEEHYRYTDIVDEIGMVISLPSGLRLVTSMTRRNGHGTFGNVEIRCLESFEALLAPLISDHYKVLHKTEARRDERSDSLLAAGLKRLADRGLSPRELEVVSMIVAGYSNLAIGDLLGISSGTVKIHRKNIYRKLGISAQSELFSLIFTGCATGSIA